MSQIRRTHPGYWGVALGLALPWYLGLGIGFALTNGTQATKSQTYMLIGHYVPLWVWGVIYMLLGTVLLTAILVPAVPHIVVRGCCVFGLMLTTFWLTLFLYALALGKLDLIGAIPAWATVALVEFSAFREPERGPRER